MDTPFGREGSKGSKGSARFQRAGSEGCGGGFLDTPFGREGSEGSKGAKGSKGDGGALRAHYKNGAGGAHSAAMEWAL